MGSQRSWEGLDLRCYGRSRCFLIFIFVLLALPLSANTYYVDCNGSDSNNGTSTSTPWQTISKVNESSFLSGDSVLFKAGCTWREQLTVPSSGSAGSVITFGAYGLGAAPIITGSNIVTGWTSESEGTFLAYYVTEAVTQPYVAASDGQFLWRNSTSKASLTPGQFFWENGATRLYVRLSTDDNPSGHTMELGQRNYGVFLNGKTNITIQNLQINGANKANLCATGNSDNLSVLNNIVK